MMQIRQPLVSVIIPLYNAEWYIAETIRSISNQTWPNIEIIVVDDGSTDRSLAVAKTFEHQKVKVLSQQNKGASAARNAGLAIATGDYIQFLDADDLLSSDKIAEQVNVLSNNPESIAVCSTIHFAGTDSLARATASPYEESFLISGNPKEFIFNLYGGNSDKGSMVSVHAWLTPAELIKRAGPWNEDLSVNDDGEFFCRVVLESAGVVKTNGVAYYRKLANAVSLSSLRSADSFAAGVKTTDTIKGKLATHFTPAQLSKCFYRTYMEYAIKSFPQHKTLSSYCLTEAKTLRNQTTISLQFKVEMGGSAINTIANSISWKLARVLQVMSNKIRSVWVGFHHSFAFRFPVLFYRPLLSLLVGGRSSNKIEADFNYVILCGAKHEAFVRQTLWSVKKYFSKIPHMYVFVDFGTTDSTINSIKSLYPKDKLHIITAEECLKYHDKENAGLKDFARKNPMGLKLAAILQIIDKNKPLLYTDTDVLWHNDPLNFLEGLIKDQHDFYMSFDYQAGYDFNLIEKASLQVLIQPPYYCAGIMFFNKLSQEAKATIDQLLPIAAAKPDHLSEQTIFAFLQKAIATSHMTPEKFVLSYSDQFTIWPTSGVNCLARHYIGPVRHLFWRDAFFKKLWRVNNAQ